VQSLSYIVRQRHRFGVAIDLDRLPRGVYDDAAFPATLQVTLEIGGDLRIKGVVEITRKLRNDSTAVHDVVLRK